MASGCITLRKYCEAVSTRAELARELFTVPARLCTQTRGENARVSCVHFFIFFLIRSEVHASFSFEMESCP